MPALVDAVVAESPVPFITVLALPVTRIGISFTCVAEHSRFQAMLRIVLTHQHVWGFARFGEWCQRAAISMSNQDMWMFVVRWISPFRCLLFVS